MYKKLKAVWLKIDGIPVLDEDGEGISVSYTSNTDEQRAAKLIYLFLNANQGIREYIFTMFRFTPANDSRTPRDN